MQIDGRQPLAKARQHALCAVVLRGMRCIFCGAMFARGSSVWCSQLFQATFFAVSLLVSYCWKCRKHSDSSMVWVCDVDVWCAVLAFGYSRVSSCLRCGLISLDTFKYTHMCLRLAFCSDDMRMFSIVSCFCLFKSAFLGAYDC